MKVSVFATSNNIKKISAPLQSRFFIVKLEPYTYEQFCNITDGLLSRHNIDESTANVIADAVGNKSQDVRDCVRIATMAKSIEDVKFLVETFI